MDATPLSERPKYTDEQIITYLKHTGVIAPTVSPEVQVQSLNTLHEHIRDFPYPTLALLQCRQLLTIPFSNASLFYHVDTTAHVSLQSERLFEKLVLKKQGGYCMENNTLFANVLRSLGFELYSVGGRTSTDVAGWRQGDYLGWSHMVNIVIIDGKKYMVDVGFGSDGPITPILLTAQESIPWLESGKMRLVTSRLPANTYSDQASWILQTKYSQDQTNWKTLYSFTELEFLPQDFEVMNFFISQNRRCTFNHHIMALRFLSGAHPASIVGTMSLYDNKMTKRIQGVKELEIEFKSEQERATAFEEYFDMKFTSEEVEGIVGRSAHLHG